MSHRLGILLELCVAGATGIEPISTVLETAILTVVLRPYEDAHATDIIAYFS